MTRDLIIIIMPPCNTHTLEELDQPHEQPGVEPIACPHCKRMAWLSAKKRQIIANAKGRKNVEIYKTCYHCFKLKCLTDPEFFQNHTRVDI